jgi:phenylalanyl-tRNA synthetase alpha chain
MKTQLEKLKQEIIDNLNKVKSSDAFRDLEIKYLGRKGELTKILRGISELSAEEKKTLGKLANEVKLELVEKFKQAKNIIEGSSKNKKFIDISLPGEKIINGHLHPITQIQNDLEDLFTSMGFMVLDGPELESGYYNFEALNIPKHHPARDMQDTFYIKGKEGVVSDMVMRTHVSPVLVRAMQKYGAPIRCVIPGRVFRSEAIDASHEHTFYQMDGLMVGKNISISNMIAVMKELLRGIFKKEVEVRVRPGFFPFVEPGVEIDMKCMICNGAGCPVCKNSGWIEVLPGGLVHPNVLRAGGLDPKVYDGFAFDVGVTRLAMMKYGIDDIRLFNSGDLRFLEQF